ncbi:MAG TPA: DUF6636 domain-containing protein [Actinomycetota bacterium]|nr:DUF6636 domain-containing protein [Actinomycetota bacterium]
MKLRRNASLVLATVAIALLLALSSPAAAGSPDLTGRNFQTPSHNIVCNIEGHYLRCDIRSGLKLHPHRHCSGDWVGLLLPRAGKARANCAGDTVANGDPQVLQYGDTWEQGAWHCIAKTSGLYCRDRGGWHFKLSRDDWRRWYTP